MIIIIIPRISTCTATADVPLEQQWKCHSSLLDSIVGVAFNLLLHLIISAQCKNYIVFPMIDMNNSNFRIVQWVDRDLRWAIHRSDIMFSRCA